MKGRAFRRRLSPTQQHQQPNPSRRIGLQQKEHFTTDLGKVLCLLHLLRLDHNQHVARRKSGWKLRSSELKAVSVWLLGNTKVSDKPAHPRHCFSALGNRLVVVCGIV